MHWKQLNINVRQVRKNFLYYMYTAVMPETNGLPYLRPNLLSKVQGVESTFFSQLATKYIGLILGWLDNQRIVLKGTF